MKVRAATTFLVRCSTRANEQRFPVARSAVTPARNTRDATMLIRQLTAAPLLSLALFSLPGATLAAKAASPLAYCKEDAARICPGVEPGGGKLVGCLKQHENEVSIGCAK